MKNIIFILLLCFSFGKMQAQSKTVFLQIDTITIHKSKLKQDALFDILESRFAGCSGRDYGCLVNLDLERYPHFSDTFFLKNDSSEIFIPIDIHRGGVRLQSFHNEDTVRINHLEIFETQAPDTIYSTKIDWKLRYGELDTNAVKIKKEVMITKEIPPPDSITLCINGIRYSSAFSLKDSGYMTRSRGHRYKPRKSYNKKGEYKKRGLYLNVISHSTNWYWEAIIKRKN
ncbi:MAG: hypothetical protein AB8F95_18710 [Bacteroidia bacterium]